MQISLFWENSVAESTVAEELWAADGPHDVCINRLTVKNVAATVTQSDNEQINIEQKPYL